MISSGNLDFLNPPSW